MRWELLIFILTIVSSWCLTDVQKKCVAKFDKDFNNDILLGTWYHIVELSIRGGLIPFESCPTVVYKRPNTTELNRYKKKYVTDKIPYSFEDNPIFVDNGNYDEEGLLIGKKQAKFFIWNPTSIFRTPEFDIWVYQRINDDYVLIHNCKHRGHIRWLMSRKRNPPKEELEAVITGDKEMARLERNQYCAKPCS